MKSLNIKPAGQSGSVITETLREKQIAEVSEGHGNTLHCCPGLKRVEAHLTTYLNLLMSFLTVLQTWTACCKQSESQTLLNKAALWQSKGRKSLICSPSAGFKVKISSLALHTHKTWIDSNLWFNIGFLYIWQRAIYTHIQVYFTVFIWFSDSFSTSTTKCPCKITEIV